VSLIVIVYVIQALLPVTGVYLNKTFIDSLIPIAAGNQALVHIAALILVATSVIHFLTRTSNQVAATIEQYMSGAFSQTVDTEVLSKAQRLPLVSFDQSKGYDLLDRAQNGHGQRTVAVACALFRIGASVVSLSSLCYVIGSLNLWVLAGLMPVVTASLILHVRWGRDRYLLTRSQTPAQREVYYLQRLLTAQEAAKEIRVLTLGHYLLGKWADAMLRVRRQTLDMIVRQSQGTVVSELFGVATSLSVTLWLFFGMARHGMEAGTFLAAQGAVTSIVAITPQLATSISQVIEHGRHAQDLLAFLAQPEEPNTGNFPSPSQLDRGIDVDHLVFSYPGSEKATLKGITFSVRAGERIAIVGENGSGKSTLVKCLLGLYQPTSGSIKYDGHEIRELDMHDFRRNLGVVFQDFVRYALSLRENVGFGNLHVLYDDSALNDAAERVGISELVRTLPEGWDTALNRMWEGGQELSLGQWQRVAIARCLLRNAPVVILDEPTASLDPKAEFLIAEQFSTAMAGRTSIMISHRLGFARLADRILVLDHGKLVEQGTHDELVRLGGVYAQMFQLQAEWYN
jgi:ATP-binding cassette subfamily B protein